MDYRSRWDERLHQKSDFTRVFQEGRRFSASGLTVWVLKRPAGEEVAKSKRKAKARLGFAVPKAYGNAVARNRLKRLIREAFRLNKAGLAVEVDMVFSARSTLVKPRYQTIEPLVLKLWTLAHLRPSSPAS